MIDRIYYWIGFVFVWSSVILSFGYIFFHSCVLIINEAGKKFKILWVMAEFFYYKREFIDWVKDKERLPTKNK